MLEEFGSFSHRHSAASSVHCADLFLLGTQLAEIGFKLAHAVFHFFDHRGGCVCHEIIVRELGRGLGQLLLAVSVKRPGARGRQFRAPTEGDLNAVVAARAELDRCLPGWEVADLVPSEAIFEGKETKRSVDMGLRRWRDMFSARQLLANATALEELRELMAEARAELGDERGRAVGLYLALAFDKAVDYNGRLSSWDATRLKVRNTFDRHDFAFKWTFAEFDGAHSLVPWAVSQVFDAYEGIVKLARRPESMFPVADQGSGFGSSFWNAAITRRLRSDRSGPP
mgnify:CR=1 FL=1